MKRISVLDCTLRDGGYINNFNFGESVISNIVNKLAKSAIDIIECGFLRTEAFDKNKSLFGSIEDVKRAIGIKNENLMYVVMLQFGAITNEEIMPCTGESVDGIRLTFHEHEIDPAFVLGKQLMEKGYKVFMQPVGTTTYTDEALLCLINQINELRPYAFYLVDTLGTMYKNDLLRMFYLVDNNLDKNITLGFHSHNNLQLSFANAQELMQLNTPRRLIIDTSIYGMGRGAGNLNTELVTQYINTNFTPQYNNIEILEIIDEYIKPLNSRYKWGYDTAYYIASVTGCHPNYASFLLNKQTLHVQNIYAILNNLDNEKKILFDKDYIAKEYLKYMNHHIDDSNAISEIKNIVSDKPVLLLAPGKSLYNKAEQINQLADTENRFTISVNFIPKNIHIDMLFISNMKRFKDIPELNNVKTVITSNIENESKKNCISIDFSTYINEEQCIADNAGLMCINMLNKIGVKNIKLAGFDGFSSRSEDNYYEPYLYLDVEAERLMMMNVAISNRLVQLSTQMEISYFTDSSYNKSEKQNEL